ncbi:MAG: SEC-C domain-containing protein [Lentisphaerae bacterium]|jgi:hypothetical protein|nr:SEC-C domain-containing protein [Lentisphaerota bacterium]
MMHANISRNAPCPCGSGRKYKHCCLVSGTTDTPAGSWTEPPEEDWEEELDSRYRYHPYAIARVVATYATNENKGKLSAKQLKTLADMWNIAKVAAMQTDDILARLRALGIDASRPAFNRRAGGGFSAWLLGEEWIEELPEPPEGLNMSAEMADDWGFEERIAERKERLAGQGA